jgi:hypothetical protein
MNFTTFVIERNLKWSFFPSSEDSLQIYIYDSAIKKTV